MVKNIAIVSLSSGVLGENFVKHELEIGLKRLEKFELNVEFMPNALKGMEYLRKHPEKRAEDLLRALRDSKYDMILCAIGGDDTYHLLPYLFDDHELENAISNKIFLGFSDTTFNHFMFHKVGMNTFYGQAFLTDICEIGSDMPAYTKKYFTELIETGMIKEIRPSDVWYEDRTDFSAQKIGTSLKLHPNRGYELLCGKPIFSGKILGGCIDSIYDFFCGDRYEDTPILCEKYHLFPKKEEWVGRILLLESCEEKMSPEKYKRAIEMLKMKGIFDVVSGILVGKPIDEQYYNEYKEILLETISNSNISIVYNVNVGHAQPRCIIPFGVNAIVNMYEQCIKFEF